MPVTWIVGISRPSLSDQVAACIFSDLSCIFVLIVNEFFLIAIATQPLDSSVSFPALSFLGGPIIMCSSQPESAM